MAYLAHQARRSSAIRSALGATHAELLRRHFREGIAILAGAIPAGLLLALGGSRLLRSMLYGVAPEADPMETLKAEG